MKDRTDKDIKEAIKGIDRTCQEYLDDKPRWANWDSFIKECVKGVDND
jgi:hypothetical protein